MSRYWQIVDVDVIKSISMTSWQKNFDVWFNAYPRGFISQRIHRLITISPILTSLIYRKLSNTSQGGMAKFMQGNFQNSFCLLLKA